MKRLLIEQIKRWGRPVKIRARQLRRYAYRSRGVASGRAANDIIYAKIVSGTMAAGKIGESELRAIHYYLANGDGGAGCRDIQHANRRIFTNAGVFPETRDAFNAACLEIIRAIEQMDVLSVWFNKGEPTVINRFAPEAALVDFEGLQRPYVCAQPWARALVDRRVLVVGPFGKSVVRQHERLADIWREHPQMPKRFALETISTPVSASLAPSPFESWSAGLDQLRHQMSARSFDIALIGAGAWSLPLAAHAKKMGRVGIHLGGDLQVLFGIRGRRWENEPRVRPWFNEAWQRPLAEETPQTKEIIENGCYW